MSKEDKDMAREFMAMRRAAADAEQTEFETTTTFKRLPEKRSKETDAKNPVALPDEHQEERSAPARKFIVDEHA
jgi:hypothetical protein